MLFFMFSFGATSLYAQSTTSPDTVCSGATGVHYYVHGSAGSTYVWVIKNGTKASGSNTDSITIDWSSTPGTDTLKVVEISSHGCPGDTQKLAIYRMPLPTATISGLDSVCYKGSSSFKVAFTGVGPWDFVYSNGTTSTTVNNIGITPYTIAANTLTSTTTFTLVSVKNHKKGCAGTVSGSATVKVFPKPTTSAIFH